VPPERRVVPQRIVEKPSYSRGSGSSPFRATRAYSNTNFRSPEKPEAPVMTIILNTDFHFADTYRMEVIAGRAFAQKFGADKEGPLC